jgi:hypothetical protein
MAFRIEERTGAFLTALLLLAPAGFAQQEIGFMALYRHAGVLRRWTTRETGNLTISETGVSFKSKQHSWSWAYQDIQQLKISAQSVVVLTYEDNKRKLGADREYRFGLFTPEGLRSAYHFLDILKSRLDQRFVAAFGEPIANPLWEIPAKHLLRFGGEQGVLQIGSDEIVYQSSKKGESRTWRYLDIQNISSSGPFQLTITTFERAKTHYGDLKGFNFELKQPLGEDRYNDLWMRLNRSKGLKILDSYRGN